MRWKDVDQLGHINNTHIATYFEESRLRILNNVFGMKWKETGVILARMEIDFHQPMYYPGPYTMHTGIGRIGNTSFEFQHAVVVVTFDFESGESVMIPDNLREKLENYKVQLDQELT